MIKLRDRLSLRGVEIITSDQKNYRGTVRNLEIKSEHLVIDLYALRLLHMGKKGLPSVWTKQEPKKSTIPYSGENFHWQGLNHSPALLIYADNGDKYLFFGKQDATLQLEGFS